MMPQGVEHEATFKTAFKSYVVVFPLMPQGVEHFGLPEHLRQGDKVVFPLMPQGVEHVARRLDDPSRIGGFSVDAARR